MIKNLLSKAARKLKVIVHSKEKGGGGAILIGLKDKPSMPTNERIDELLKQLDEEITKWQKMNDKGSKDNEK